MNINTEENSLKSTIIAKFAYDLQMLLLYNE